MLLQVTITFAFDVDGATTWATSVPGLFGIISYAEMDTVVGITDSTGAQKSEGCADLECTSVGRGVRGPKRGQSVLAWAAAMLEQLPNLSCSPLHPSSPPHSCSLDPAVQGQQHWRQPRARHHEAPAGRGAAWSPNAAPRHSHHTHR
jgi:hypothetical protein